MVCLTDDNFTFLGKYIEDSNWKSCRNVKFLHYDVNGGISLILTNCNYKISSAFCIVSVLGFLTFQVFLGILNFEVDLADSSLWRRLWQNSVS